ncbi:SDR family NAD(P)-dependent oxidoreductase [Nonomuraea insulae]|uniref:SDR family NAD(P)-dependent oxidoreductase n=1 Tax=Nonomuraea insulae TaxID=1616787 RepID=A0ABW1CNF0_9ACTN
MAIVEACRAAPTAREEDHHMADRPPEPVAIIGASCRLPGGIADLEGLWAALLAERDLVTDVPPDRFDPARFTDHDSAAPGKTVTIAGGFFGDIAEFDAEYFRITPREAEQMDPRQRMMLEMAAEAFDDAGLDPATLAGSTTSVYVGAFYNSDYMALQYQDIEAIDKHTISGTAPNNIANRISYHFDLRGESLVVDTACSSFMTALHQACRSVRDEGGVTVAGAVNLLLSPHGFVSFAKGSLLSPTGRCHTFSADADGYVRAEGGGLLVLKRLSEALADGDRIHAVLLDTATNTDGRTPSLTFPSQDAQHRLLLEVYERAGVLPDELAYFEAHGTGTPAGDRVECTAIGLALGNRRSSPLPIGSVKTNLGHLESAAGLAGVLKAILVMRHGMIPASLHSTPLNPDIDFTELGLAPVSRLEPVVVAGRCVIGVSSFGFGGSNGHAILAAPPEPAATPVQDRQLPLIVSARTRPALAEAAHRLSQHLADGGTTGFYDTCYTACRRRGHHQYRAAVLATGPEEAARRLLALADGRAEPESAQENAPVPRRIVFAFSGNGSQWAGMGAELLTEASFREAVASVDAALSRWLDWSVMEALATADPVGLARAEIAQPALFAVQIGLTRVLAEQGITPDATFGHSVGEIAAAHLAGALDLEGAARVVVARSVAQARTAGCGRMAAVGLSATAATELLAGYRGRLDLAAINSDRDVTISGDPEALAELWSQLDARDVFFRPLDLNYAFHSRAMAPIEDEIRAELADLPTFKCRLPMVSTVTGELIDGAELDAAYWWRNIREPVLFHQAGQKLTGLGHDLFVEIGPRPILGAYLRRLAVAPDAPGAPVTVVPTLNRDAADGTAIRTAVATLLAAGATPDWNAHFPSPGRVVDLPAYPWQRERHWNGTPSLWGEPYEHPLLGERARSPHPDWHAPVEHGRLPWLADHIVDGTTVMPATGFAEMALAAGGLIWDGPIEALRLDLQQAFTLPAGKPTAPHMHVSLSLPDGQLHVSSRADSDGPWRTHAHARVRRLLRDAPPSVDITTAGRRIEGDVFYGTAQAAGLDYGPAFRVLDEVWVSQDEVVARYTCELPAEEQDRYQVHPALLDGALQATLPLLWNATGSAAYLPASISAIRRWQRPGRSGLMRVRSRSVADTQALVDIIVTDDEGTVAVELEGCRLRRFTPSGSTVVSRYTTVLRAAPRPGDQAEPVPLPPPEELLASATAEPDDSYGRYQGLVGELTAHFTAQAIDVLLPDSRTFGSGDLHTAGVQPKYDRLMDMLLRIAHAHGLLAGAGMPGRWRRNGTAAPERVFAAMVREFPSHMADLSLRAACGRHLAEALDGSVDPLDLVVRGSASHILEAYYDSNPLALTHNSVARDVMRAVVDRWPADRALRVLEVGAGTGGLTAALLPVLPADRTQYLCTDVSEAIMAPTAARLSEFDFVEYRRFDLDLDPISQGLDHGSFDIIVAAHSLHTSQDLAQTLRNVAVLAAEDGLLLSLECGDSDLITPIFGLLDGWWAFNDQPLRTGSPLLSPTRWLEVLSSCGYRDTAIGPQRWGSTVLLTRCPIRAGGSDGSDAMAEATSQSWLIAADRPTDRFTLELRDALATATGTPPDVTAASAVPADWTGALAGGARSVVLLLGDAVGTGQDLLSATIGHAAIAQALASACADLEPHATPRLCVVTGPSGVHPAPEPPDTPGNAAIWGLTRSLNNELPQLKIRRISLERGGDTSSDARRLARELLATHGQDEETVLTRRGRFVPRVIECTATDPSGTAGLRVERSDKGHQWVPAGPPPEPGPDELIIAVRAAGLNYRDVLAAAGELPQEALDAERLAMGERDSDLGLECAGVVAAVGSQIAAFAPGDRVVTMVSGGALASWVRAKAHRTGRLPDHLGFPQAATMLVAFRTVHHALLHRAQLAAGETILIHGAAGGVGLAAVQFARSVGAEVIATAGTAHKRDFLRTMGLQHVIDSRSPAFAEEIRAITGGTGVDVVLNSLSGEAIPRGMELLRPNGRFIELGKYDIYRDRNLPLRTIAANTSLCCVELFTLAGTERDRIEHLQVMERIEAGTYQPLPFRSYPARRMTEAFDLLRHSRHVGKVVVTFDEHDPSTETAWSLDPDATYLITGGLGGFGAATAVWLAGQGARHLALVGRRGADSPEAERTLSELERLGAHATPYAADVTDADSMRAVLHQIDRGGHPLRGVVHAAMVLDDAPVIELTPERFQKVLAPKILGAQILHHLTRDHQLDHFITFSSVMGMIGNVKQANYNAANLYLEALTRARRAVGLPGLTIVLGHIAGAGNVARNPALAKQMSWHLPPVDSADALEATGDLIAQNAEVTAVAKIDWGRMRKLFPALATSSRFSPVMSTPHADPLANDREDELRAVLSQGTGEEVEAAVNAALTKIIADIIRLPPDLIDADTPLGQLGIDSLMAVELTSGIRRHLGTQISVLDITSIGIRPLANRLTTLITPPPQRHQSD